MYPFSQPAPTISSFFTSGTYTPSDVCLQIRDQYTPINKLQMMNSVGAQISLLQNFVNSWNAGYPEVPINSGYFTSVLSKSGFYTDDLRVYNTSTYFDITTGGFDYYSNPASAPNQGGHVSIGKKGLYFDQKITFPQFPGPGFQLLETDFGSFAPSGIYLYSYDNNDDSLIDTFNFIASSGMTFILGGTYTDNYTGGNIAFNLSPLDLTFSYIDSQTPGKNNNVALQVNPSGGALDIYANSYVRLHTDALNVEGSFSSNKIVLTGAYSATPYTASATDYTIIFTNADNGSTQYIILPNASTNVGRIFNIMTIGNIGGGVCPAKLASNGADVILVSGGAAQSVIIYNAINDDHFATLQSNGTYWQIIAHG